MNTDLALREQYLRSTAAGHYTTNQVLITLSPQYSFWFKDNEPTLERWCIFAHEFAHCLHNFSTIAGLWDFVTYLKLTRFFVGTVGADGRSRGRDALSEPERRDCHNTIFCLRHLRGTARAFNPDYHRNDVQIKITGVNYRKKTILLSTQPEPVELDSAFVSFTVWTPRTPAENCTILFGSWHIMEALAHEIERIILAANHVDVALVDQRTPTYPYKLGRFLFEHCANLTPSSEVLARACLMALQSTDPGATFIDIATAFATRPEGQLDAVTLENFEKISLATFKTFAELTPRTLQPEFESFAARGGPIGHAIATLGDMCQRYVDLRLKEHFFELSLFAQTVDRDHLEELLKSFPPCPIVHEATWASEPQFMNLSFTALAPEDVDALCAYQALHHFVLRHLPSDEFVTTAQCRPSPCVFFGACAAEQSLQSPQLCQTKPWSAFRADAPTGCLYAAAVSAARGRSNL
jgi:hypothetical protein